MAYRFETFLFADVKVLQNEFSFIVFTRISVAALIKFFSPQVRRLFEGGAYLKFGRYKEIFPFDFAV